MSKTTLTIPFAADPGDGENHWIRLEHVRKPDEGVTMAQAAALIDAMYGIEPCEDGMGNGGEAADEEALPEEEDFLEMAREMLDLDICDETEPLTWDAEVDVFRSHQEDAYNLQGELIEVGEVTPMSRSVTEVVDVGGNSHDLTWPCAGGVSVSGAGATVRDVRGSTVNFTASVRGRVRISYTAVWDRVKLKVRRFAMPDLSGGVSIENIMAVAGDNTGKTSREDDEASVVAFWRDLAAECALTRPPLDDQGLEQTEIQRLCNRKTDWHVKGDCWQTIETYNICNCSGRESPDVPEREDVDAPCPEGVRPDSFLGTVRIPGEYVDCPGEDRELLNDPDFYRSRCCDEPYPNLPRCRVTREPHRGGAEIEGGPEHWRNIYGPTVRMIPITPEGGCGEIIRKWDVPMWRDCGDDPDQDCASAPHPSLPGLLIIAGGSDFELTATGGKAPFSWHAPSVLFEVIGESADGRTIFLRASDNYGAATVSVTDACVREANCRVLSPEYIGMGGDSGGDTGCYAFGCQTSYGYDVISSGEIMFKYDPKTCPGEDCIVTGVLSYYDANGNSGSFLSPLGGGGGFNYKCTTCNWGAGFLKGRGSCIKFSFFSATEDAWKHMQQNGTPEEKFITQDRNYSGIFNVAQYMQESYGGGNIRFEPHGVNGFKRIHRGTTEETETIWRFAVFEYTIYRTGLHEVPCN